MAPNKKKKKAVANPARGFATVSVAKKQQTNKSEDGIDQEVLQTDKPGSNLENIQAETDGVVSPTDQPLHKLSPEELELHLENADLQVFLEKHSDKIKRDASRHVTRLKTEKRLLRTQAESLNCRSWLPREILQQIHHHLETSRNNMDRSSVTNSSFDELSPSDDLVAHMWKLSLILPRLGFSHDDVEQALKYLSQNHIRLDLTMQKPVKDSIWGLESCLDWLASKVQGDGKSAYNLQVGDKMEHGVDLLETNDLGESEYNSLLSLRRELDEPIHAKNPSLLNSGTSVHVTENEASNIAATSGSDSSESESDMELDQMVSRYVELQTRMYIVDPESVAPNSDTAGKRRKKHISNGLSKKKGKDGKIVQIQQKITRLTSDILFDQQLADVQWARKYIHLCQEDATRRRYGVQDATTDEVKIDVEEKAESSNRFEKSHVEEEPDVMLGTLFDTLPEVSSSSASNATGLGTTNANGNYVDIRDFGTWNGVSPRRVLEEVCKARDPSVRLEFKTLSESAFSYRHALTLHWTKSQIDILPPPFESVSIKIYRSCHVRIEMHTISCPGLTQSEAFVAMIALFVCFARSPKEEKSYLRLPSVWRGFWGEMTRIQKEKDDAFDRQAVKELRALVADSEFPESMTTRDTQISETKIADELFNGKDSYQDSLSSGDVKDQWSSKSSSRSYQAMSEPRRSLPIWQYRDKILESIEAHQVVIICGATGCGKSTQVPAYILEKEMSNGRPCKIYCAEPRRISAISLARRVSAELGELKHDVGTTRSLVGFAIRLESKVTALTRLVYATTGIVMRMLEGSHSLNGITHLLLDEVHERSIDSDFLLIILRKLLVRRPSLKVVLMSATVDAQKFSRYLGQAPVFEVPGRTFPVEAKFLEDAVEMTSFKSSELTGHAGSNEEEEEDEAPSNATPNNTEDFAGYNAQTRKTMSNINEYRIPYELIVRLLQTVNLGPYAEYSKATLVFLPGIAEIRRLSDMLHGHSGFARQCEVFALHSSIATEEQERAFLPPPSNMRKIVLATNIAETGITIPDITCVIDTGKHKEMRFDERRQLSRLIEAFVSQANVMQRRGRAGRVQKGLCFHLFSKQRFEQMSPEQTPEMLRLSLQDLVLRVKICKLGGIDETLSEALDPPSAKNIRRAIDALQDVKALTASQELTSLGKQLAKLPLDVFLGKLLLVGTIFGCSDAAVTIAAILSNKSPFTSNVGSSTQADQARLSFKRGDSDLLTVYNAYAAWRRICSTNGMSEQQFCRRNMLSPQTLSNIEDLKGQLFASLVDAGFVTLGAEERSTLSKARYHHGRRTFFEVPERYNINHSNDLIINSTIAISFYPKLLKREGNGWRNVANNQAITLHPSSVNRRPDHGLRWLSFYHIMQSSSKHYNAHETSAVEDMAVALLCGEADFRMYAGVIVIDGNRIKFAVSDSKTMLALKTVRNDLKAMIEQQIRYPGKPLSGSQCRIMGIWQQMLTKDEKNGTRCTTD